MSFFNDLKKKYTELLNPVKNSLSDDKGWFQQGKLNIGGGIQQAQQRSAQSPMTSFGPLVIPNFKNQQVQQLYKPVTPYLKKFGEGFGESSAFGLIDIPNAPSQNLGQKLAYGAGFAGGVLNPFNPLNKAMGALNIGGKVLGGAGKLATSVAPQVLSKVTPRIAPIIPKIVGGGISELAQAGAYTGAQKLLQRPLESIGIAPENQQSFGSNLAFGLAGRGLLSGQSTGAIRKGIGNLFKDRPYVSDFKNVNEALQRLKTMSGKQGFSGEEINKLVSDAKLYNQSLGIDTPKNFNKLSLQKQYDLIANKLENMIRSGDQPIMGITSQRLKPKITKEIVDRNYQTATRQLQDAQDLLDRVSNPNSQEYEPKSIKKASEIVNSLEWGLNKAKKELESFYKTSVSPKGVEPKIEGGGNLNPNNILKKIDKGTNGLPGAELNQKELDILGNYLKTNGDTSLRGKITEGPNGTRDVIFGTIKDRQFKGQTEYLVMADSGPYKGAFRLSSTPIDSNFFGTKVIGEISKPSQLEPKIEVSTTKKIQSENLPTQVQTLSDMTQPTIKQPSQVDSLLNKATKPNKLDSASEQIIQQARNQIGKPTEPKKSLSQRFDEFYTNWVDRYNPLVKLTEGVKNIDPNKDPKYIIRRFLGAGSIAEQRFETEMKPILKTIDDLKIDKTDLDTYLINKRNVGFGEIGRQVKGSDPVQSQKVVSALEAKYGDNIKGITDQLYNFQNQGLDDMVKAGFISPESASAMRGQNPNYAPFQRVMDEMNDYLGLPTKKAMQGTQPIKKLKGSEKQILSPVESIIANIFSQRAAIEKNNVAKSIVGLKDIIPNVGFKKLGKEAYNTIKVGEEYVRQPKPLSQLPDSAIVVWNNGKREAWDVGSDIGKAMKGMNEETMSSLMKILTAPASLLRQGATGRNPEFMVPNVIRDQLDAATNSKYGYVPFVDYIRGLYHVAKKDITGADEVFDSWMKSGGAQSFSSISGRKSISEMFDKTKAKKGLFSWLGSALDIAGKYSETPTRLGLYGRAIKKGATSLEAAYESREGTMDFARMGAKMKVANSIIPFLNVQVQGFDKMIRNFKNSPAQTTLKMGIYGVTPAVMATLYNEMYHPDEYSEIPQYVKDDNFVLVKGRNDKGTVDYVAIPKGNLIRLVTNPAEHFVSYLAGNDKTTFGEMATQLLSSNLPLLGEGSSLQEVAIKTIGQNIPQAIKPITENLMNKSFYKYDTKKEQSKEIVPYYLQNKAPADQTYKFTPAMYQVMGKVLNQSPLKIQNLMEGYLAGYTKIPANVIDSLKNISEGKEVEQNKIPILRRFIQETYPTSTTIAKPKAEASPLIPQVQANEGGLLDKIFPNRNKKEDLSIATEFTYTNENGNESKINLTKFDDIRNLPTGNRYETAIKESKQYTEASKIIDNSGLTDQQKQIALQRLGISQTDATYYAVANDNNNLKTLYSLDKINDLMNANGSKQQILDYLTEGRKEINGKMIVANGVLDNLVDEGIITKAEASALKQVKLDTKGNKISLSKAKKPKKVTFKKPKIIKLKAPKVKIAKIRVKSPKRVKAYKRPKIKKLAIKRVKLKMPKA